MINDSVNFNPVGIFNQTGGMSQINFNIVDDLRSQIGSKFINNLIWISISLMIINFVSIFLYKHIEKKYKGDHYLYLDLLFGVNFCLNGIMILYLSLLL